MDRSNWQRNWTEQPGNVKYALPMHMLYHQGFCNLWETPHSTQYCPEQDRASLAHSRSLPLLKDHRKHLYSFGIRSKRLPWENKLRPVEVVKGKEPEKGFYIPMTESHFECPLKIWRSKLITTFGSVPLAFNTLTTLRGKEYVNRVKWRRAMSVHFGYGQKYSDCIFDLVLKEKYEQLGQNTPAEGSDEFNTVILSLSEIAGCDIALGGVMDVRRDVNSVRIVQPSRKYLPSSSGEQGDNTLKSEGMESTLTRVKTAHRFSESHPLPMRRNLSLDSCSFYPLGEHVSSSKDFFSFSRTPTLRMDDPWKYKGMQQTPQDPNVGPGTYNIDFANSPWEHAPVLPWRKAGNERMFQPVETEVYNISSGQYQEDQTTSQLLPRQQRGDTMPHTEKQGACWNQSRRYTGVVGPSSAAIARHSQRRVGQMGRLDDAISSKLP